MTRNRRTTTAAIIVIFGTIIPVVTSCGPSSSNPVEIGFGQINSFPDHREIEVGWQSSADTARLSGTLYLPYSVGVYGAMVIHMGSNRWTREPWNAFYASLAGDGIAVLGYDKRGVGRSDGECCPVSDPGYFPLLAGDLVGAVRMLAIHGEIDPNRIGLYGSSQGGWVVPTAAAMAPSEIAFAYLASGPTVSLGEELLYSQLTGDAVCVPTGASEEEIDQQLDMAGPSRFDPRPYLESLTQPVLWQYCENDTSIPVTRSIRILDEIRTAYGSQFQVQLFPNCNHTFVKNGGMCQLDGIRIDWQTPLLQWLRETGLSKPRP